MTLALPMQRPYLNALKYVLEGSGNDASLAGGIRQALHGEGLPTARLAICKNSAIVALSDTLCEREPKSGVRLTGPGGHHGSQPTDSGTPPGYVLTKALLCPQQSDGVKHCAKVGLSKSLCWGASLVQIVSPCLCGSFVHSLPEIEPKVSHTLSGALPTSHTLSPSPLFNALGLIFGTQILSPLARHKG